MEHSVSKTGVNAEHVMYVERSFLRDTVDAGCSCGWEACEFEDIDAAEDAWTNHCDVVFMEATMRGLA